MSGVLKKGLLFLKVGTYEYYDAEVLFGVDFDGDEVPGYDLEIIEDQGTHSLEKDGYGNLYLVDPLVDDINPLFYKNIQLKNNFLSNKTPLGIEIVDDDPIVVGENIRMGI